MLSIFVDCLIFLQSRRQSWGVLNNNYGLYETEHQVWLGSTWGWWVSFNPLYHLKVKDENWVLREGNHFAHSDNHEMLGLYPENALNLLIWHIDSLIFIKKWIKVQMFLKHYKELERFPSTHRLCRGLHGSLPFYYGVRRFRVLLLICKPWSYVYF